MSYTSLQSAEVEQLLERYGPNTLHRQKRINPLKVFLRQFTSPITLLLIVAALTSIFVGFLPGQDANVADAVLIIGIVALSALLGFFQEYKAEHAVEALQGSAAPHTVVLRDGKKQDILSQDIVPGDIVFLQEGNEIPADGVILETSGLIVNEAPLTGESVGVEKVAKDAVARQTYVMSGDAVVRITATGMQTRIGAIADKLETMTEEKSPFEKDMARLSTRIVWIMVVLIIVVTLGSISKYGLYMAIMLAISLAVAAIPEGLPAVITMTLAATALTMHKRHALTRRLSVIESLGGVEIICTDKTGTLTQNNMEVRFAATLEGVLSEHDKITQREQSRKLLLCTALSTKMSHVYFGDSEKVTGDPMEVALRRFAEEQGYDRETLIQDYNLVHELPFTSERKIMSMVYRYHRSRIMFTKGAPEILLEHCTTVCKGDAIMPITPAMKRSIHAQLKNFASKGLRVLGFAMREIPKSQEPHELELTWLGLIAMMDPPRDGVAKALQDCTTAGIRVVMLTGDNPLTAQAIAKEVGLGSTGVRTGNDLDAMDDPMLEAALAEGVNIFARVSPDHKLRLLNVLQKRHHIAMTGDGINDVLALKRADVGISMGLRGTEVAKQASDLILLDDNFATIVEAIRQGRRVYDNLRKFLNYLFVSNIAEVMVIFLATLILPLSGPLLFPVQLLWINLLTDGLPALALGVDRARPDIMRLPPRPWGEGLIDRQLGWLIGIIGAKKTILLISLYIISLRWGEPVARTVLFTGFVLFEFIRIASIRAQEKLTWLSNPLLLAALGGSLFLQLLLLYSPYASFFDAVPLGRDPWMLLLGFLALGYILAILLTRLILRLVPSSTNKQL